MAIELAATIVASLASVLTSGLTKFSDAAGADLWKLVKDCFKKEDEKKVLNEFENAPNNENNRGKMEWILKSKMDENQELKNKIENAAKNLEATTSVTQTINQSHTGQGNNTATITNQF